MSLAYMYDFHNIEASKLEESVPFYCGSHARDLITDYHQYKIQQSVLQATNNINYQNNQAREMINYSNDSNNNIEDALSLMNPTFETPIHTKTFNFIPKSENLSLIKDIERLEKPKIQNCLDDAFIQGFGYLSNDKPSFNIDDINLNFSTNHDTKTTNNHNNTIDFTRVSRIFYDHFKTDSNYLKTEKKSNITLTELKELKEFLILIIKTYRIFDNDLQKIYYKLFEQQKK